LFRNRKTIRFISLEILLIKTSSSFNFLILNKVNSNYNDKKILLQLFYCQKKNRFVLRLKTRLICERFNIIQINIIKMSKDLLRAKNAST